MGGERDQRVEREKDQWRVETEEAWLLGRERERERERGRCNEKKEKQV